MATPRGQTAAGAVGGENRLRQGQAGDDEVDVLEQGRRGGGGRRPGLDARGHRLGARVADPYLETAVAGEVSGDAAPIRPTPMHAMVVIMLHSSPSARAR
jgi:hypothetical protein